MTILNLQDALAEDIGRVLKGIGTKNVFGEYVDGVKRNFSHMPL